MFAKLSAILVLLLTLAATTAWGGRIPEGYAGIKWGSDFHRVIKTFPKGELKEFGSELVYKQTKPDKTLAQRLFAFREGKLYAVTIKFNASHVQKTGLEKIVRQQIRKLGEGKLDNSGAPHMIKYVWEGNKTRITLVYAPKRPDMTVMMFEQK